LSLPIVQAIIAEDNHEPGPSPYLVEEREEEPVLV
jgi:hypothetical protein